MASVAPFPPAAGVLAALPARRKLRVGVFADAARQPRWIVESLAKVASCDFAELVVVSCENRGQTSLSAMRKPGTDLTFRQAETEVCPRFSVPVLWSAYARLDRKVFGGAVDWSEPCDLETLVPRARRLGLDEYVRGTESMLDVAIAVGDIDDDSLEGLARYGVWRHSFGEGQGVCEALAGVREVIEGAPVTASGLRVHLGGGLADRVAYRSWARTLPVSIAKSRANVLAKTSEFLVRALHELHLGGAAWLEQTAPAEPPPRENLPAGADLARDLALMGKRVAQRSAQKLLQVEQWTLAFRFTQIEPWNGSLEGFFRLTPPKDRFWADPFPIQRFGKNYIFFEELPFATGKAHISVIEVDRDGRASEPVRVLERDHHLSYPFLVEDQGELYMIPESADKGTVEIFRCVDFPRKWRRERVLLEGVCAVDATVHREGGRWWMFANCSANGAEMHDELNLFSATRLLGEWTPHGRNPVKSDVRSARPAGRLFRRGKKLYRPAQICAPLYGTGVAINRVTRLDDAAYAEETERRIIPAPGSGILGLHTVNRAGDLSVVDAFLRRPRF